MLLNISISHRIVQWLWQSMIKVIWLLSHVWAQVNIRVQCKLAKNLNSFHFQVIVTAAACLAIMTLVLLDFYANSYTKELLRYPNLPLTQKSKESITESYSPWNLPKLNMRWNHTKSSSNTFLLRFPILCNVPCCSK